jgi:hypothetical protein
MQAASLFLTFLVHDCLTRLGMPPASVPEIFQVLFAISVIDGPLLAVFWRLWRLFHGRTVTSQIWRPALIVFFIITLLRFANKNV